LPVDLSTAPASVTDPGFLIVIFDIAEVEFALIDVG
jgi:hypothetical protein